jgi:hypothetical protein
MMRKSERNENDQQRLITSSEVERIEVMSGGRWIGLFLPLQGWGFSGVPKLDDCSVRISCTNPQS